MKWSWVGSLQPAQEKVARDPWILQAISTTWWFLQRDTTNIWKGSSIEKYIQTNTQMYTLILGKIKQRQGWRRMVLQSASNFLKSKPKLELMMSWVVSIYQGRIRLWPNSKSKPFLSLFVILVRTPKIIMMIESCSIAGINPIHF